tara:strand:- start:1078 stop:1461 length:384 start_codon:yes stop_codon:yes gene_type:complete
MYLVDTDVCVQYLRNDKAVVRELSVLENLHISTVTLAELFFGLFNSKKPEKHKKAVQSFLSFISVLDVTFPIAFGFGNIKARLKKKGHLIQDFDILNGSIARTYSMTLVTRNVKHYSQIDNLNIQTL